MPANPKSIKDVATLAAKLPAIKRILSSTPAAMLAGGGGNAAIWDSFMHGGAPFSQGDWDTQRAIMTGINAGLGVLAGQGYASAARSGMLGGLLRRPDIAANAARKVVDDVAAQAARANSNIARATTSVVLTPTKDLVVAAIPAVQSLRHTAEGIGKDVGEMAGTARTAAGEASSTAREALSKVDELSTSAKWGLGALGAGALALGAIATGKYLSRKDPNQDQARLRLRLPGKKNDPSTQATVEIPIDKTRLSPSMLEGLDRGVRLQVRKNVRANSFKRDPHTGKLVPYEDWQRLYGHLKKAASSAQARHVKAELVGNAATSALASALGALAGQSLAGGKGLLAGALAGAAAPTTIGLIAGLAARARTASQQRGNDIKSTWKEHLLPGYGAYQTGRRLKADEEEDASLQPPMDAGVQESFAATGSPFPAAYAAAPAGEDATGWEDLEEGDGEEAVSYKEAALVRRFLFGRP